VVLSIFSFIGWAPALVCRVETERGSVPGLQQMWQRRIE